MTGADEPRVADAHAVRVGAGASVEVAGSGPEGARIEGREP